MAYGQENERVAYIADADYSTTGQYRAVKRTTTGFVLCGANSPLFLGVLQDDPKAGENGTIKTDGVTKAVAGAAFAAGLQLTTDSAGRFVAATTGQQVLAVSLEPAAALGDITTVNAGRVGLMV